MSFERPHQHMPLARPFSQFDFKKYTKEDRELAREYDSSLTLHMSAIRYVHTKRFLAETLAFLDHFMVLDTSLQVLNTLSTGLARVTQCHVLNSVCFDTLQGSVDLIASYTCQNKPPL